MTSRFVSKVRPAGSFKGHFTSKEPQESGWVHLGSGKPSEGPSVVTPAAPALPPQVVPPAVEVQASPPAYTGITVLPLATPDESAALAVSTGGQPQGQEGVSAASVPQAASPSAESGEVELTMNDLDVLLGILSALHDAKDLKDVATRTSAFDALVEYIENGLEPSPAQWVESHVSKDSPAGFGVCCRFDENGKASLIEENDEGYSASEGEEWFELNVKALVQASNAVALKGIVRASVELSELSKTDEDLKALRTKFLGHKTLNLGAVDARGSFSGNKVRKGLERLAGFLSSKTGFSFKVNVDGKFQVPQVAYEGGVIQQVGFKTLEGLPLDWFVYEGGGLSILSTILAEVVPGQNNKEALADILGTVINVNKPLGPVATPQSQPRFALANFALRGNLWTSTARAAQMFTVKGKNGQLHTNGQEIYSRISSVFVDGAIELTAGLFPTKKAKEPTRVFVCDYSSPSKLLRGLWDASALHFGLYRLVGAVKSGPQSEKPNPTEESFKALAAKLIEAVGKSEKGESLSKDEQRLVYLACVLGGKGKASGIDGLMLVGKGVVPEKLLDNTTYQFRLEGMYGEATKALHAACMVSSSGGHGRGGELYLRIPTTVPSFAKDPDGKLVRSEVPISISSPDIAGPMALDGYKSAEEFEAYGRKLSLNAIVRWGEEFLGAAFKTMSGALNGQASVYLKGLPQPAAPGLLGAAIAALEATLGQETTSKAFAGAIEAIANGAKLNPAEALFGKGAARREAYLRDGVLLVDMNITKQANKAQWKALTKHAVVELPDGSKLLYGVFMTQGIGNTRASHQGEQYGASVMTRAFLRELPLDLLREIAKDILGVDELPAPTAPTAPGQANDEQKALISAINKYGQVPFFGPATAKALHLVMGKVQQVLTEANPKAWNDLKGYAKGMRHAADGHEEMGGEIDDRAAVIVPKVSTETLAADGEEGESLNEAIRVFDAAFARSKETREFLVDFNQSGPRKAMLEIAYRAVRNVTTTPPNRFSKEMETFFGVEAYLTDLNAIPANEPNGGVSKVNKGIITIGEMFGLGNDPAASKTMVLTPKGPVLMTEAEAATYDGQLNLLVTGKGGKAMASRRVPVLYGVVPSLFGNIESWAKTNRPKSELASYAAIGFIYRYPIASADNISPALMVNLKRFFPDLDLPVGYYANSKTIKENLCGDTDGDKLNFMPLGVNFELYLCEGSDLYKVEVALDTVDALQVYQYTAISTSPAPSIEDFTGRTSTSPRSLALYETEKYIDISQSLIGPSALMQQINNNLRIALKVVAPRPMAKRMEVWETVNLGAGVSREAYKVGEFAKAFGTYSDFSEKTSDFLKLLVEQVMFFDVKVEEKAKALASKQAEESGKTLDWSAKAGSKAAKEAFSALHKAKMDVIYGQKDQHGHRNGGEAILKTLSRQAALGYVNTQLLPPADGKKSSMAIHAGKVLFAVLRDQVMLPLSTFLPVILETGGISSQKKDTISALMWAFSEMLFDATHVGDNGEVIWVRPKPAHKTGNGTSSLKGYPSLWATMRPFHSWNKSDFTAYPVLNFYTDWAKSLRKSSEHGEEEAFDLNAYADINLYDGDDDGQAPAEPPVVTVRTNSALGKALFTIGSYMMFHCGQNYKSNVGGDGRIEGGNELIYRPSLGPDPMRNEDGSLRMTYPEGTRAAATRGGAKQTAFEDMASSSAAILFGARGSNEKLFPFNPEVVMKLGGMVRDILQALCTSFEGLDENEQPTWAPLEFPSPNALPAMVEKDRRELITRRLSLYVAKYDDQGERVFDRAGVFGPWKMFYDATPSATNAKGRLQARVVEKWAQVIDKALGGSASRSRFNAQGATTLEFPLDKGVKALSHVNALTFANDATPVTALVQLQAQVAEQTKDLRGTTEADELRQAVETYALSHLWEVALSLPANVEKQLETFRLTAAGRSALPRVPSSPLEAVKKSPFEMALFGLLGSVTLEVVATKLLREAKNQKAQEPKVLATEQAMFALLNDLPNRVLSDKGVVLGKVAGLQALLSIGTFATKFGVKAYNGIRSEYGAVASYYLAKAIDAGLAIDPSKSPSEVLKGLLKASPVMAFFKSVWGFDGLEAAICKACPASDDGQMVHVDINGLPEEENRFSTLTLLDNPGDYAWSFVQMVEKLSDPKERAGILSLAMAKATRNSFKEMTKELSKENLRRLYEFSMYRFPAPGKATSSLADNFRHAAELVALHKALLDAKGQQGPVANIFQVVVKDGQPKFEVVKKPLAQLAYEHYSNARVNKGRSDGLLMAIISEAFEKSVTCVEGLYGLGLILESPEKLALFDGDTLGCIAKADGTGFFIPLKLGNNEEGRYIERVAISKGDNSKAHLVKEVAFGVPVSVYVDRDGTNEYTEEKVGWLVGSNRLPAMASCGYVVMETATLYDAASPSAGLHLFDKTTDKLETGTRFSPWAATLGSKDGGATLGSVLMASKHWLVDSYDELGANGKGLTALPRFLAVAEDFVPGLVEEFVADVGILAEESYKDEALDLLDETVTKENYVKRIVVEYLENAGFSIRDFYPGMSERFDIVGTFEAINEVALALMGPFHAAAVRALFPAKLHFRVAFNRKGVLRASHLSDEGLEALIKAKEDEAKEAAEEAALADNGGVQ